LDATASKERDRTNDSLKKDIRYGYTVMSCDVFVWVQNPLVHGFNPLYKGVAMEEFVYPTKIH
jgi:hypothetical protein